MDKGSPGVGDSTYKVALALPWTLTVMSGIQVPRYSNAAWVVRLPPTPPAPGPPSAVPWDPEPEPPGKRKQKPKCYDGRRKAKDDRRSGIIQKGKRHEYCFFLFFINQIENFVTPISELTGRCTDSSAVPRVWYDEEGLDEGAQSVHNVSEYLGGVRFHVVRLTERTKKGKGQNYVLV